MYLQVQLFACQIGHSKIIQDILGRELIDIIDIIIFQSILERIAVSVITASSKKVNNNTGIY